jgi:ribosomal protein S18 acetylase RimI-like enzyme
MKESDIEQVQQVAAIAWNDTYKNILPQDFIDQFVAKAYSSANLRKRLTKTEFLVSENNVGIDGFISITKEEEAELAAIYLLPGSQGKGIGTQLLNNALKRLTKLKSLLVYVEKENKKGMQFYLSKGFHVVEEFTEELLGTEVYTVKLQRKLER